MLSSFFLYSCEQEEVIDDLKETTYGDQILTRTEKSIADFDVLSEIGNAGVPVNIVNKVSGKCLLMNSNKTVSLTNNKDDQNAKWSFNGRSIKYVGSWNTGGTPYLIRNSLNGADGPMVALAMDPSSMMMTCKMQNINNTEKDYFYIYGSKMGIGTPGKDYLQPQNKDDNSLVFNSVSNLSSWSVEPIGEYEFVKMEYVRTDVDNFTPLNVVDKQKYIDNREGDTTIDSNVTLTYNVTENSTFSKTEGITMNSSSSIQVGLPILSNLDGGSLSIGTTVGSQVSNSYTFGESEQKTYIFSDSETVHVPAHKRYKIELMVCNYTGTLTYVITMRHSSTGKTFRMRGKWFGDCFAYSELRISDVTDGDNVLIEQKKIVH